MVVVFREVDATVVPRVAVAAALRLQARKRSLGSIARSMLEKRAGRVVAVPARVEKGGERRHAARLAETVQHAWALLLAKVGASGRIGALNGWLGPLK
jgi:hypothetical protein